jgi:hypothetical protein
VDAMQLLVEKKNQLVLLVPIIIVRAALELFTIPSDTCRVTTIHRGNGKGSYLESVMTTELQEPPNEIDPRAESHRESKENVDRQDGTAESKGEEEDQAVDCIGDELCGIDEFEGPGWGWG